MERFRLGQTQALIATTVIEVGIDVPNANIMLIENAERFGLAQLHQLRGRIGRGEHKSYCVLLTDAAEPGAMEKLRVMEETSDGFQIAEADLRLRGPGDILGTQQSGLPPLRLGDILRDGDRSCAAGGWNRTGPGTPSVASPTGPWSVSGQLPLHQPQWCRSTACCARQGHRGSWICRNRFHRQARRLRLSQRQSRHPSPRALRCRLCHRKRRVFRL